MQLGLWEGVSSMNVYGNSILDTIGNTPLVRINKLWTKKNVEIYAKVEGHQSDGQHQGPHCDSKWWSRPRRKAAL